MDVKTKRMRFFLIFLSLSLCGCLAVIMADHPAAIWVAMASNIFLAMPGIYGLFLNTRKGEGLKSLLSLAAFAYFIESLGVITGYPYGAFFYGDRLGPLSPTGVPFLLPFSWVPLVIGAVYLSRTLFAQQSKWRQHLSAAGLLVLVDLGLDPVAAHIKYWTWVDGGPVYGVPLSNFGGWVLSGLVGSLLVPEFQSRLSKPWLLALGYLMSLVMWSAASLYLGFYGTAVVVYGGLVYIWAQLQHGKIMASAS